MWTNSKLVAVAAEQDQVLECVDLVCRERTVPWTVRPFADDVALDADQRGSVVAARRLSQLPLAPRASVARLPPQELPCPNADTHGPIKHRRAAGQTVTTFLRARMR